MQQKKVWFQKGQNLGSNVTAPSFLSVSRIASSMMWLRPVQLMLLKTNITNSLLMKMHVSTTRLNRLALGLLRFNTFAVDADTT